MIKGVVTSAHQATISVGVRDSTGRVAEFRAIIDTGFSGALSLPAADIAGLGLPWRRRGRALLADGTEIVFDVFEANVSWDGIFRRVAVHAAEVQPLVGMSLLEGHELIIQVVRDGQVRIRSLAGLS